LSEPFVGEIRMFAGNFAPRGWAFCDGQLLAVSQNDALFSLLGTIYGGDGMTTFGLPDLRGRIPIHAGSGPGLAPRPLGQKAGVEKVTLTVNELPSHVHRMASTESASGGNPGGSVLGDTGEDFIYEEVEDKPTTLLNAAASGHVGGSRSHSNLMPSLCIHFIIALVGIYPSRH
jgi:microcystin-dependent protein